MLSWWLDQPVWALFLILAAGFLASAGLIHFLSFSRIIRGRTATLSGVVAPFFSALSVLLALLTGFVANDTWERQKQASRVMQSESDNVLAVYDLSVATVSDMSAIRRALQTYVEAVLQDEWPGMASAQTSSRTAEALGTLLQEVAQPQIATDAGMAAQSALLNSVLRIRSDRGSRLALNEHRSDDTKWLVLLILGVLTQVAIGIVHLDKPRAQLAAMLIFTTGLVSTLGLVAIHEWPFDGPVAVKPTALEAAHKIITAGLAARAAGAPLSDLSSRPDR